MARPLTSRFTNALPGVVAEAPTEARGRRDRVVNATMYVFATVVGAATLVDTWEEHPTWLRVVAIVVGIATVVSLHWRKSHPGAVGIGVGAVGLVILTASGALVIATFNGAIRARGRDLAVIVGLAVGWAFLNPVLYPPDTTYLFDAGASLLMAAVAVGWGLFVRARRALVRSLRDQAERAGDEARAAERRRIAREMHDVLAHRLSLLSVHAGALEFRPDAPPEEIAEAASVIRDSARAALDDLRGVIGVLREDGGESFTEPPQPTIADLPALVEESRRAGMRITAQIDAGRRGAGRRRRPHRLPHRAGGSDQRAQARAGGRGDPQRPGARRRSAGRDPQPRTGGRPGGVPAARGGDRADRARGARHARRRRARIRRRPRRRLRPPREAAAMIRVLLVDDDALVRSGLRMMLAGAESLEVVGEAADGREVLGAVDLHRPDVVLMDIRMPQVDGIAATRLLVAQPDPPAVIVLTTFDADELVLRALQAGAAGFLLKETSPAEIVRAIELVHAGDGMLSPAVTRRLIAMVAGDSDAGVRTEQARERLATLSPRERDVALAVGRGLGNAEIAATLFLSVPTVKGHVSRLLDKLEVDNRVQIALLVQAAGEHGR